MPLVTITREEFLLDRQGRTFTDLLGQAAQALEDAIRFFNDEDRQRRMQESEIHHDRAALAGVVRELETQPSIDRLLSSTDPRLSQRLRQAVGVMVRMIMEKQGWKKTGKKGSLGVRSDRPQGAPHHNTGGLAFWFLRAERYELAAGMPFASVRQRCRSLSSSVLKSAESVSETSPRAARAGRNKIPRRSD
jgi:hypothetical protein